MDKNQEQDISIKRTQPSEFPIPAAVRTALNSTNPFNGKAPEKPKYPSEPINIPSEGHFYSPENPLSSGIVDIKYMTAREEDILTSQNLIKKGLVLERLLESLIVTPGVKLDDILIGDKNAIFLAARILAYGSKYGPLKIKCNHCDEENDTEFDLSQIQNKDLKTDGVTKGTNSFAYTFPYSKRNITFKFLTHKDEKDIDIEIKSLSKFGKTNSSGSELTTRLKYIITSIDGKSDPEAVRTFVENELLAKDNLEFRKHMRDILPDVDMSFKFTCQFCNHEERMVVPISAQFFWPDTTGQG